MIGIGDNGNGGLQALRALMVALALTAASATVGCQLNTPPVPSCVTDDQCGGGNACMAGSCIQQGVSSGKWAIEVVPRSDSMSATTRLPPVAFTQDVTVLTADRKVTVVGTLPDGASVAGASHMVVALQSPIPGYNDLQIETDSARGMSPNEWFNFSVPAGALNQLAAFHIFPLSPSDLAQPPVTVTGRLTPTVDLSYSSIFSFIHGNLISTAQTPQSNYTVRAYVNGQLASNVVKTTSAGEFRLSLLDDPAITPSGLMVTVELTATGSDNATVRFVTPAFSLPPSTPLELGALTIPPAPASATYRLKIVDPSSQPVAGAAVRVHTDLSADRTGAIDFTRDGVSDGSGNVDLLLLAGTSGSPRSYDVAVLPPPGSRFGSACQTGLMITGATPTLSGGAGAIASALSVPLKATVPGKIVGADGAVVAGVSVAATPTAAASALNCGKAVLVSPPTSTTTDRDGTFQLMLDPGTYQFDYDPAAGSSVPRLTETKLAVSAGGNDMRLVRMLPGALIKGLVQDASGAPLPQAGVRFLEVACVGQSACYGANRVSPILRGDTHTDADGTFRVVVPAQMP